MSGRTQSVSIFAFCVMGFLAGCKGGTSKVADRGEPHLSAAPSNERARGTTSRSSRREIPALAVPLNAAHYSEGEEELPSRDYSKPQHSCPVDGSSLGGSGAPVTVTLKGEPVFVCCPACAKKAQKDPDKVLARVRAETAH